MERTITADPGVDVVRMHEGRAVLEARPDHAWESGVVLNPAAVLVEAGAKLDVLFGNWNLSTEDREHLRSEGGAVVMLYRAQGEVGPDIQHAASSLGLAILTPLLELVKRWGEPVLKPTAPFHNLGVEDPRCTRIGDTYYLYYTGYSNLDPEDPVSERQVRICLATTEDFLHWNLRGPVEGDVNDIDNKNAALLPNSVSGKWLLLHRPMEGPDAMAIHLAEAQDPAGPWNSRGMIMASYRYREFETSWVGAGGPPIPVGDDRFAMIYHQGHFTREGAREYDLSAALLDCRAEQIVQARIEPLVRPSTPQERLGDSDLGVNNVVFTCANYRWKDQLIIPYAGADSCILGASVAFDELVAALEQLIEIH
jgi:predicted GH43/DUF377 family glycosyl hydrolase